MAQHVETGTLLHSMQVGEWAGLFKRGNDNKYTAYSTMKIYTVKSPRNFSLNARFPLDTFGKYCQRPEFSLGVSQHINYQNKSVKTLTQLVIEVAGE